MKVWKKNLIAGAILLAVCGGIFLNWRYTQAQAVVNLTDTLDTEKLLSQDLLVMGDGALAELPQEETTRTSYFAAVRLSRQQARDSALTLLQEAMSYSGEQQTDAHQQQLEQIVNTALCEAQIESLVVAKGYEECVAYISSEGISVAVASPEGGMQQQDAAVIADIVMSQSEYTMEQIRIVEVQ